MRDSSPLKISCHSQDISKMWSSLAFLLVLNILGVFALPSPQRERRQDSSGNYKPICKTMKEEGNRYTVKCDIDKQRISYKTRNILWLQPPTLGDTVIDIPVENYKIDEWILAAYNKVAPPPGPQINVLVKRPEVEVGAQVEEASEIQLDPQVNLEYEPVSNNETHFPTDRDYTQKHPSPVEPSKARPVRGYDYPIPIPNPNSRRHYRQTVTITEEEEEKEKKVDKDEEKKTGQTELLTIISKEKEIEPENLNDSDYDDHLKTN